MGGVGEETAIAITTERDMGLRRLLCRISRESVGGTPHAEQAVS